MIAAHLASPTSFASRTHSPTVQPPAPSSPPLPGDGVAVAEPPALLALLGFHRSIRASLQALDGLTGLPADSAIQGKAATLHDFFRWPMRWHDEDESASLLPRLRSCGAAAGALAACAGEHDTMEAVLDSILGHLHDVGVGSSSPDMALLTKAAHELRFVLEPHLRREETELFPLARRVLTNRDLDEMASEMRVRRLRRVHDIASRVSADA